MLNDLIKIQVFLFFIFINLCPSLLAKENISDQNKGMVLSEAGKTIHSLSNINNWAYWIWHDGRSAHNPFTDGSGGFFPRGTSQAIYMDGLVWGGIVDNPDPQKPKIRVGGNTYRNGTQPGWWGGDPNDERAGIYRIRSDWETLSHEAVKQDAAEQNDVELQDVTLAMTQKIIDQYAEDWENWPVDLGAPFVDTDEDGQYTKGVDLPGIADAKQVLWFVVNDGDETRTKNLYGSPPIGLEVQTTIWSYTEGPFANIIFKRYVIINKSEFRIDSMYVAQWSDPDIGDYSDDLVGCDVEKQMGFAYNGDGIDIYFRPFGLTPPAIGYRLFAGPYIYTGNAQDTAILNFQQYDGYKNLPMTSFAYFNAGGDWEDPVLGTYDGTLQWYNLLRGYAPTTDVENPSSYLTGSGPNKGNPTKFPLSGDPVADPYGNYGDVDGAEGNAPMGDRRMALCTGPFDLEPNERQEVIWAVGGATGSTNRNAVNDLKQVLDQDPSILLDFDLPKAISHHIKKDFLNDATIRITISVQLENAAQVTQCSLKFESRYGDEGVFTVEMFDDGNHGDDSAGDHIWGATTNVVNKKYPFRVSILIKEEQDILETELIDRITLRKPPAINNYRVTWENGAQDQWINHNEKVHLAFDILNPDIVNDISDIEVYSEIKNIFDVNIAPGTILDDGSVYLTLVGPAEGDTFNVNYKLKFDQNVTEHAIKMPLKAWQPTDAWRDTLEVRNISRPGIVNAEPVIADAFKVTGHQYEITYSYDADSILVWNLKDLTKREVKLAEQILPEGPDMDFTVIDGIEWKVFTQPPGLRAVMEEDQDGNVLAPRVSILDPGFGTTGYIISNRAGAVIIPGNYTRDFDRFDYWESDDVEINFADSSLTWDYIAETIHFDSTDGSPFYAPFAVYRHKSATGEKIRLFAGFWDSDKDGAWNVPQDGNGNYEWVCPVYDAPSYEPIYCYQGYDSDGNEASYDPKAEAQYITDNSLYTSANTTWAGGLGEFKYPFVTAVLFAMYQTDATPPYGNKVMFYTNKPSVIYDTLHVMADVDLPPDQGDPITDFHLSQNYPNPFNSITNINVSLPRSVEVRLDVYDVLGQKVKTLVNKTLDADRYTFQWDGANDRGTLLATGIYFYKLKTKSFTQCKKMLFLK